MISISQSGLVAKLNHALVAALRSPDVRHRLVEQLHEPVGSTPEEFARFITAETEKWHQVIKISGAHID